MARLLVLFTFFVVGLGCQKAIKSATPAQDVAVKKVESPVVKSIHSLKRGDTVFSLLKNAGVAVADIHDAVRVAKPLVRLSQVNVGAEFTVVWKDAAKADVMQIEYRGSPVSTTILTKLADDEWEAREERNPITTRKVTFAGTVESNLWESAERAGMDTALIGSLAEIFAWQVDFARTVRQGDRWRLTVEQQFVNGEFYNWGPILIAEYENAGELFTGIRYPQSGERGSYYFPDGSSLRRMFLKSPLKFGRITSKFTNRRFHPIYKRNQPHNGVDYAAPRGTPVMAVGDGVVEIASRKGAAGKMVRLRHNSQYQTAYCHLSGYAKGVRPGTRVQQGQVIGYVGSTGASTGPHLHFVFYENGRFVDPLGKKFPSADPVAKNNLPEFKQLVASVMNFLPDWQLALHSTPNEKTPE